MPNSLTPKIDAVLKHLRISLKHFDPSKSQAVCLNNGKRSGFEKFQQKIIHDLGTDILEHPEVVRSIQGKSFEEAFAKYAEENGVLIERPEQIEIPESFKELKLNIDVTYPGRDLRYFLTTPKEIISEIAGGAYMRIMGYKDEDAVGIARKVAPEYLPRSKPGVTRRRGISGEDIDVFNSYIPPKWMDYEEKTPPGLPKLFEKLVKHLFPSSIEREYFYDWLHASLFSRAFVYLILCGPGGTGKNRLKLVMRALHGHQNTVDGKRSTLSDRFNSQLADSTLTWFDELHYDLDTENVMKEVQNDSISIERKGIDATRSTKIYSSLVISNNKPRDNYIAFDARKFVPLQITNRRLDDAMTTKEIDELTGKVEDWSDKKKYDPSFIAQIGRWLQKRGYSGKWHHLEYKGPMFYKLAHTSMSRWQKRAASIVIDGHTALNSAKIVHDKEKGYLWSTVVESLGKKNGDRSLQFPDFTTVQHFFDVFVDGTGKPTFKTSKIPKNIMGDFHVKLINKNAHILTEAEVLSEIGNEDVDDYDL